MSKDLHDLLDAVDSRPGWRVEKTDGSRWKVYPPKPHGLIFVSASGDPHAIKNVLAQLRRAGFDPNEDTKVQQKPTPTTVAVAAPGPSPVAIIRHEVEVMMNSLAKISDALSQIDEDNKGMEQLKTLLRTVMK